ncbi:MAG: D-alanyl-D-alanine carboxypeptidase family protein [Streptosporangiaceae bacterium]
MQTSRKRGRSAHYGRRRSSPLTSALTFVAALIAVAAVVASAVGLSSLVSRSSAASGKPAPAAAIHGAKDSSRASERPDSTESGSQGRGHVFHRREVGGRRLGSSRVVVAGNAPRLPQVPASAYVIANAKTGAVLAAKDAHGLYQPASTLKILTAITMLPRLKPDASLRPSKLAASVEPNIIGVVPGHRYKVADLFRALLMISANDAAVAIIQAAGSFSKGIALMNAEAHHLQAYDVVAKQPNGLPAPGQVVSAYDLALIARAALAMPAFMRYDSTRSATFHRTKFGIVHMVNENGLLTDYRGGLGGKTGWTMTAGATYVGMARRNGVTLIVTILHAKPLTTITSAEKLLNWGFAANGKFSQVGTLVPPLPG